MHPELSIFWYSVDSYRLFFASGWIFVVAFSWFYLAKRGFDAGKILMLLLVSSIFSLVWARLFHFFLYGDIYAKNPDLLWNTDLQWQAIMGGLIVGGLSIFAMSMLLRLNHWRILDVVAVFAGLGLVIGRIGCLLAGCCFWEETDLPIGITFPLNSLPHRHQVYQDVGGMFSSHAVHPTQAYEMIAGGAMFAFGWYLLKKKSKDGIAFLSICGIYLIFRLIGHQFRAPALEYSVPEWFYPMFYGVGIVVILLALLRKSYRRRLAFGD